MAEIVRDDQLPAGAGTAREVDPVPAASVLLLRDDPLEVLMIRRHERSSFVPNAWVFPGGSVDEADAALGDGSIVNTMRVTAARELFEETGIWLGLPLSDSEGKRLRLLKGSIPFRELFAEGPIDIDRLVWTGRWITPVGVPKRFDTYFFLACVGRDAVASADQTEAVEVTWISPGRAVERHMSGEFPLVFPTLKNLEAIVGFADSGQLLKTRRKAEIVTTRPVLIVENGQKKIVLP
jgi:8-oxo-dGTP pyrophosphatase MutT (NUDIX family)